MHPKQFYLFSGAATTLAGIGSNAEPTVDAFQCRGVVIALRHRRMALTIATLGNDRSVVLGLRFGSRKSIRTVSAERRRKRTDSSAVLD